MEIGGAVHATAFVNSSDKRLKSDIRPFDLGINELMHLSPVTYFYNGKGGIRSERMHVGILAQELEQVAPEFVSSRTYKQFDENQEKVLFEEDYLQIHDNEIKYLLINAIKDLKLEIDDLREEVNSLTATETSDPLRLEDSNIARLYQNVPNPSKNRTSISYYIPNNFHTASVEFFDISGRQLEQHSITQAGKGSIEARLEEYEPGTMLYVLVIDGQIIDSKKLIHLK